MTKLKSLLSLALIFTLNCGVIVPVYAKETSQTQYINQQESFNVYCSEFPDAYIITEVNEAKSDNLRNRGGDTNLGNVTATVFVDEQYAFVDGKTVVTESRLLSKEEVEEIGEENFNDLGMISPRATSSRGKLTISFSGSHRSSGSGVTCNLSAIASWSGFNAIISPTNNPAVGTDFAGITWSGGFTASNSEASALLNNGGKQQVYSSEYIANSGRVWEFDEYYAINGYKYYVKTATFATTLTKAKKEGNGNTAEAVFKYIHTYQSTTGSASISAGPGSVNGGFSLANTSKQWSISCAVTGIPY